MIERVALRIESGGRHLLRAGRPRKRMLHSAFWVHGAAEIDFVAAAASVFGCGDAAQTVETSEPPRRKSDVLQLDFLYPSKTLAFLRNLSATLTIRDEKVLLPAVLSGGGGRRMYSSSSVARNAPETPSETDVGEEEEEEEEEDAEDAKRVEVEGEKARAEETEGHSMTIREVAHRLKLPRRRWTKPPPGADAFEDLAAVIKSYKKGIYDIVWYHYSVWIMNQERSKKWDHGNQARSKRRWTIDYLLESPREIDHRRLLRLLTCLPPWARSDKSYRLAVECVLRLGYPQYAVPFLRESIKSKPLSKYVTKSVPRNFGYLETMAYCISRRQWDTALEVHQLLDEYMTDKDGVWRARWLLHDTGLPALVPGYAQIVTQWVRGLPEQLPSNTRKFAEDLLKGLLKSYTVPLTNWDPHWEEVWDLMKIRHLKITQKQYERVLWHLASHGQDHKVAVLYHEYRGLQRRKSVPSGLLNAVLDSFRRMRDFKHMQLVFNDLFDVSVDQKPDPKSYRIIMSELANNGESQIVEELLEQMAKRYSLTTQDICIAMQAHAKRGDLDKVLEWFDRMASKGLKHSVVSYNILLKVYSSLSDVGGATQRVREMLHRGLHPDTYTYSIMMGPPSSRGDVETTEMYFDMARDSGCDLGSFHYHALTSAYVEAGDMIKAVEMIQRAAEEIPDQPQTQIWNTVLAGYASKNDRDNMLSLYDRMLERQVPFDSSTYGLLMHSFCLSDKIEAAENLISIMKQQGFKVDHSHYGIIMVAYTRALNLGKVLHTFNMMLEDSIPPTFLTISILIQAYAFSDYANYRKTGFPGHYSREAEQLLNEATSKLDTFDITSFEPVKTAIPPWLFTPLMSIYTKEGLWDRSIELFERFMNVSRSQGRLGAQPNIRMYIALMNAYAAAGNVKAVRSLFSDVKLMAREAFVPALPQDGPPKVLPAHRFELTRPFSIFIRTLSRVNDIGAIVDEASALVAEGYDFDNINWNDWVRALALSGSLSDSAVMCEKQLMMDFDAVLKYVSHTDQERRNRIRRGEVNLPVFYPFLRTVETLATELKLLDDQRKQGDTTAGVLMKKVWRESRKTWDVCNSLGDLETRVARELSFRQADEATRAQRLNMLKDDAVREESQARAAAAERREARRTPTDEQREATAEAIELLEEEEEQAGADREHGGPGDGTEPYIP